MILFGVKAKQLDTILRQGQKGMSDSEFQKKVDEVMALHAFTPGKRNPCLLDA